MVAHAKRKTPLGDLLTNYELVWATTNLGDGTRPSCSSLEGGNGGVAGSGVGFVLLIAGLAGMTWAESANKFFEPTVRHPDRPGSHGHRHRSLRRRARSGIRIRVPGVPRHASALGSLWALIPAAMLCLLLVARTILEDRTPERVAGLPRVRAASPIPAGAWGVVRESIIMHDVNGTLRRLLRPGSK